MQSTVVRPPRRLGGATPQRLLLAAVLIAASALVISNLRDNPLLLATTVLNGVSSAALYFIVASGFTLIFGLLRVTNLAHGSFYLLGGYIGYSIMQANGNWFVALVGAGLAVAVMGLAFQLLLLRRVDSDPIRESLLTIGLSVVVADLTLSIWGGTSLDIGVPSIFDSSFAVDGLVYSKYRVVLVALALVIGAALYVLLQRTRLGMTIRAGVDDPVILATTGVNVPLVLSLVFGLGAFLAGVAGVAGGSYLSVSQGEDARYLLISLLVVIVGGLGSIPGAAAGALLVGLVEAFAQVHLPTYSVLVTFGVMIVVLAFRPQGLFGGVR